MTFDATPGWVGSLTRNATATGGGAIPCVPAHPTLAQVAELVTELFSEGSLTFDQLCSLRNVPELEPLLERTVASVRLARRG